MSKMLTKNGWNIRIDGSREVWVYNDMPSTLPSGNGRTCVFVARFKYLKPRSKANAFVKFLTSNFTPAEYFALYATGMPPLTILQTKGF